MNSDIRQSRIADDYLRQVGPALNAMPADVGTEIVAELRNHLVSAACDEGSWDAGHMLRKARKLRAKRARPTQS